MGSDIPFFTPRPLIALLWQVLGLVNLLRGRPKSIEQVTGMRCRFFQLEAITFEGDAASGHDNRVNVLGAEELAG